jgi:hypothetical protein
MLPSFHYSPLFLVISLWATCNSFLTSRRRCLWVHALASTTTTTTASSPPPPPRRPPRLRFFIAGLGYCGARLADRLRLEFGGRPESDCCHIAGCVRSEASKQRLLLNTRRRSSSNHDSNDNDEDDDDWLAIHVLDLDQDYQGLDETGLDDLKRATHIIQTIAPVADLDRDPLLALHSTTLLQQQADEASSSSSSSSCLQWVGYLSSTGVYGDHGGDWVDEDSELKCHDAKSLARVHAEQEWRDFETTMNRRRRQQQEQQQDSSRRQELLGAAVSVVDDYVPPTPPPLLRVDCFRCGGIYGPDRGPLAVALARLDAGAFSSQGMPEEEEDDDNNETPKYINRILVDDICGAMVAAIKANMNTSNAANPESRSTASVGSIYNLVDDDPAPRRHVVEEANRLVLSTFQNQLKLQETPPSSSSSSSSKSSTLSGASSISPTTLQSSSVKRPTSRSTGNKRCKNHRLKDAFHWTLLAPTYREGLRICLESYRRNAER